MDIMQSSHPSVNSSNRLQQIMRRHPLACYFLLAYSISWLGWLPYVLSQSGLGLLPFPSQLAGLPGGYGPLVAGLLMTGVTGGKAEVRRLLHRLVLWRVGWQWYLFALIGVPAIFVLGFLPLPGPWRLCVSRRRHSSWSSCSCWASKASRADLARNPGGAALPCRAYNSMVPCGARSSWGSSGAAGICPCS
jgi:hypothetical protein